jgi:pilus assembly protein Flp/PilA
MLNTVRRCLRDSRAATAIEYGLIIGLICVAAMGAFTFLGTRTITMWNNVSDTVSKN